MKLSATFKGSIVVLSNFERLIPCTNFSDELVGNFSFLKG